jgi:Domain of unknown function (DUF4283)
MGREEIRRRLGTKSPLGCAALMMNGRKGELHTAMERTLLSKLGFKSCSDLGITTLLDHRHGDLESLWSTDTFLSRVQEQTARGSNYPQISSLKSFCYFWQTFIICTIVGTLLGNLSILASRIKWPAEFLPTLRGDFRQLSDTIIVKFLHMKTKAALRFCFLPHSHYHLQNSSSPMANIPPNQRELIAKFESLVVRNKKPTLTLQKNEMIQENWGQCLLLHLFTTRPVNYLHLKEALMKSWSHLGLDGLTRFSEGAYVVEFESTEARDQIVEKSPWHFKQELIGVKKLNGPPNNQDITECRALLWVQFHCTSIRYLINDAVYRMTESVGEIMDTEFEGREKWGRFARIRMVINPFSPLKDRILLELPGGRSEEVLVHYERIYRACLFCSKIGHETEGCAERQALIAHICTYPLEIRGILREKLKPQCGGWVYKDYNLPREKATNGGSDNFNLDGLDRTDRDGAEAVSLMETESSAPLYTLRKRKGIVTGERWAVDLNEELEVTKTLVVAQGADLVEKLTKKAKAVGHSALPLD